MFSAVAVGNTRAIDALRARLALRVCLRGQESTSEIVPGKCSVQRELTSAAKAGSIRNDLFGTAEAVPLTRPVFQKRYQPRGQSDP